MLVDTQPATYQHIPASADVRDQWVNSRLIGVLMDKAASTLLISLLAIPPVVVFLWQEVDHQLLMAWACALSFMIFFRYRLLGIYRMRFDSEEGLQRQEFIRRYQWSWIVVGALWGFIAIISYGRTSVGVQFICGILVTGQSLITLVSFCPVLPIFRGYAHTVVGMIAIALILDLVGERTPTSMPESTTFCFLVLLAIYWWVMMQSGARLHQVYRSSLELQFSNQELIDSLTQQTRASLRAVAAKNRFLASAAHDLRQPVHALSLYADWLSTEPEMARDISPRILQSTRAINELFDSLFDLTRIDAGNYKVRLQYVEVQQLFADLASQFAPVAESKSLRLRTRARQATVWSDPVVLRRILGNMLSNALKHTSKGGVLLGLRHRHDMLVFEVWDTGVGIAREHQQAIFQEFFRVSQHHGTEDSLGLGLTIVSKLSTMMGYQLALSSQANKGSVFRVMIPFYTQEKGVLDVET